MDFYENLSNIVLNKTAFNNDKSYEFIGMPTKHELNLFDCDKVMVFDFYPLDLAKAIHE